MARKANNKRKFLQMKRRWRAMKHVKESYAAIAAEKQQENEAMQEQTMLLGAVLLAAAKGEELVISMQEVREQIGNAQRGDVILYDEERKEFLIRVPESSEKR